LERGSNGAQKDQISICIFFGVVPDALRPHQRPASIMYGFLLSSEKKGEKNHSMKE